MNSRAPLLLAITIPTLLGANCRNRATESEELVTEEVVAPEVSLQVVSIQPDRGEPDTPLQAQIFGQDFQSGVRVWVGSTELSTVVRRDENTLAVTVPGLPIGPYDIRVSNTDGVEHTLRGGLVVRAAEVDPRAGLGCDEIVIHFELDSSRVDEESARILTEHMACFLEGEDEVRIEGHCDERGTTDYNLALGQRRADAVESWLVAQGVPSSRLRTISYGEEQPADSGGDENSWQLNRRSEIDAD